MDEQLAQLLASTQLAQEGPRKLAELELLHARTNPEFPSALARIAALASAPVQIRQAALTTLRKFVEDNWSNEGGDAIPIPIPDPTREQIKNILLELVLSPEDQRKVKLAAR